MPGNGPEKRLNDFSVPVSVYELLAYFVPGAAFLVESMMIHDSEYLLCLLDATGGCRCQMDSRELLLFRVLEDFKGHTFVMLIFLVIFGYILGFILSAAGSLVLEKFVVKHVIGYPFVRLLDGYISSYCRKQPCGIGYFILRIRLCINRIRMWINKKNTSLVC